MAEGVRILRRLPFSLLPGASPLFRDYVDAFQQVADLFRANPRRLQEEMDPDGVLGKRTFARQTLAEVLEAQNRRWGCGPQTRANIELLKSSDALVVITGQQVGLFTGPLYTIYKALTVLELTRRLGKKFPFRFVPLFWMAADDHDYAEVAVATVLDRAGHLIELRHSGEHPPGLPVGGLRLGQNISALLETLSEALPKSEYKPWAMASLRSAYYPEATFADAFGRMMLSLFADQGLVLVDPRDPELRRLAAPVFRRELEGAPGSAELVSRQSDLLVSRGYHAQLQVAPPALSLFLLQGSRRSALVRGDNGFRLKRGRKVYSLGELDDLLENSPERFSPGAALRPVVQDSLFPVAAYVAGPAEIAYFAQLGEVYRLHGVPMPAIYPRASFSLVEGRIGELLKKFGLLLEETFVPESRLASRVAGAQMPQELEELIGASEQQVRETFRALADRVSDFEPGLRGYLDGASGKVSHQLKSVRRKLLQAQRARNEILREQAARVGRQLYPAGRLQERVLNSIPFLVRHGPGILGDLKQLAGEPWEHLAIQIGRRDAQSTSS